VLLLLFSILFATVLERPVLWLERRGWPRAGAILTMYVVIFATLIGLGVLVLPPITNEALAFWEEAPVLIGDLADEWRTSDNPFLSTTGYRLLSQLKFRIENPPPPTGDTAIQLISSVGGVLFGIVATFITGFYYLMEKRLFKQLVLDFVQPESRARVDTIWTSVESKVGDWLRGQLILMLIIGCAAGIFYATIDLRFWLLLAVLAGITEAVPIVGPWVGGIPAVAIALADSWQTGLIVAAFLLLLQLAENTILVPRVMRNAVGLTPLTVFFAVLAGGVFYGPLGALLALPIAAAIQVIVQDSIRVRHANWAMETGIGSLSDPNPSWRSLVNQFLQDNDRRQEPDPAPLDPPDESRPGPS
jgi:predicted PurR-regulated permease PerM